MQTLRLFAIVEKVHAKNITNPSHADQATLRARPIWGFRPSNRATTPQKLLLAELGVPDLSPEERHAKSGGAKTSQYWRNSIAGCAVTVMLVTFPVPIPIR